MKNIELNRYDMKVLESYIINIEKLKFRKLVREYELHDNPVEDNPGASRSNIPSDPTYRHVSINIEDDYYNNLDKIIKSVYIIYESLPEDTQQLWRLRYWEQEIHLDTWERLAKHFFTSKTTLLTIRAKYLKELANRIDYVSSDM